MSIFHRSVMPLLALLLSACTAIQPQLSSDAATEPSPNAWAQHTKHSGDPRSDRLWIDGRWVQFFDQERIESRNGNITIHPQPTGWRNETPRDLLVHSASPWQASIKLKDGISTTVQPLQPITLTLRIVGYSGSVEVHLYDDQQQAVGTFTTQASDGRAEMAVTPRGAIGPQWALIVINDQIAGAQSDIFTLEPTTALQTGRPLFDRLYPRVHGFMEQGITEYTLNGQRVRGYRSPDNPLLWLRDHVYQGRGFRYFETDVVSLLDAFRQAQRPDGSFPDVIDFPDMHVQAYRKEVEADLEYLFVQGVYEAWQMTGDDDWLRENLEAMRQGLRYITDNPLRWDAQRGLVRRPYTIDTWDFAIGPTTVSPDGKPAPRHWIDEQTIWGIFHGDNTGLAYALELMARIEEYVGDPNLANDWREQSRAIIARLNALSWNGSFYTHFIPISETVSIPGLDTAVQLSLSNAFALNRDGLDFHQGRSIVAAYYERHDPERAFAEWYSIDPPFPSGTFGLGGRPGDDPGEYVNGGIMPLVGGELARGAFNYGAEGYAFDILRRYAGLIELTGQSYLWYYPNGNPGISGPDTLPTDGWGSSAMLSALFEGAAGIVDRDSRYRDLFLSPRWAADPELRTVDVVTRYAASDGYVAYSWRREEQSLTLDVTGSWENTYIRLLLPAGASKVLDVQVDGQTQPVEIKHIVDSRYVVVEADGGNVEITVLWR